MSASSEPSWLAGALRPVTEIRPGEAGTALLLSLNVFLLLSAYYVIKPVREALILALESGAEYKAYMSGVIAVALAFAVPLYARLVDRLPRLRLVVMVTLAFAAQLLLFFVATNVPALRAHLGLLFYVWVGVFNMMVVAQFWAYTNDIYDPERGVRLIPLVALGASLGAAFGSQFAALLIPVVGISPMLVVAAGLLVACAGLFLWVERREGQALHDGHPPVERKTSTSSRLAGRGAFSLVLSDRYLLLIALFSLVFSWVNTNGEYMLGKLIKADALAAVESGRITAAAQGEFIGAAYSRFFFYVNVAGVFLQTFVVSRFVRRFGFQLAFLVLPLIALGNAAVVAVAPLLAILRVGKTVENATDYSLNNTLRQMLWLVTSTEMKYKAKQAIDTFCVRIGDVSSALSIWICASLLAWPVQRFAWVSVALVGVWFVLALAIARARAGREGAAPNGAPALVASVST